VEDLLKVKGFGKKKLEKAGDELSVGKEAEEH
jgi:DNA uptake protein ComE-like DNA-binding protein